MLWLHPCTLRHELFGSYLQRCINFYSESGYGGDNKNLCTAKDWLWFLDATTGQARLTQHAQYVLSKLVLLLNVPCIIVHGVKVFDQSCTFHMVSKSFDLNIPHVWGLNPIFRKGATSIQFPYTSYKPDFTPGKNKCEGPCSIFRSIIHRPTGNPPRIKASRFLNLAIMSVKTEQSSHQLKAGFQPH